MTSCSCMFLSTPPREVVWIRTTLTQLHIISAVRERVLAYSIRQEQRSPFANAVSNRHIVSRQNDLLTMDTKFIFCSLRFHLFSLVAIFARTSTCTLAFNPFSADGDFMNFLNMEKSSKITQTLSCLNSLESSLRELSNEYKHDRV